MHQFIMHDPQRRPPYDVECLLKENGLAFINTHFPKIKFKGKGHEKSDLKQLITNYREWAFQMYPSMNFKDIVQKTQSFSSKAVIKGHLQKMRDQRDGVGMDLEIEEEEDHDLEMKDNADSNVNQPQQERLERRPDGDVGAEVEAPANQNNAAINGANSGNAGNAANAGNSGNPNARKPNNDPMGFGGDPMDMMDMMDFGGDPDEDDIARAMYG